MQNHHTTHKGPLFFVTIVPEALLAIIFLALGAVTLISPDVPQTALVENTVVGTILVAAAAVLVYAVFRPYSGGLLMIVFAVLFGLAFNGFDLSTLFFPERDVGYHVFWSAVTAVFLMFGILSFTRGRKQ